MLQNASAAYGTEFYVGAMRNSRGETDYLLLYITTPSVSSVSFSIETTNGSIGSYNVSRSVPVNISLPTTLVTNDGLYSSRFKGVYINSTNGGLISVLVFNIKDPGSYGEYMAYPYQNLAPQYQYYAVSTRTVTSYSLSEVLLVGNEDNTTVTVTPTQTVSVPIDIQTNSNSKTVTAGSSFNFTIHRMQTFLIGASLVDISGTSIVSDKPLTVISGHECTPIPDHTCCCQHLAQQILPTIIWGREFLLTPYATRTDGPYFKVVAALGSTSLSFTCSASGGNNFYLQNAGDVTTLHTSSSYCSIVSDKPVLVTQLGPSHGSGFGVGDPIISLIPPIELHQENITLVIPGFSSFYSYINIATTTTGPLYINGQLQSVTWNNIYNSTSSIIGYGAQIPLYSVSTTASYTISMQTAFTTLVYGLDTAQAYSYSAGINLTGIGTENKPLLCMHVMFFIRSLLDQQWWL